MPDYPQESQALFVLKWRIKNLADLIDSGQEISAETLVNACKGLPFDFSDPEELAELNQKKGDALNGDRN